MPVPVTVTFSDAQAAFIREAADLVAPGLTNQQVVAWVAERAADLVAADVKARIVAHLREEANAEMRVWEQGYLGAFPVEVAE